MRPIRGKKNDGKLRRRAGGGPRPGVARVRGRDDLWASMSYREALRHGRDESSRAYLSALLRTFRGNVSRAAKRAGVERESLYRLLRRYELRAEDFRAAAPSAR